MVKFILVCLLLGLYGMAQAQDTLSVTPVSFSKSLAEKFSETRILNVEYGNFGPYDFKSKLLGQELGQERLEVQQNVKTNINIPVLQKQKWRFTVSQFYHFQNASVENYEQGDEKLHYFKSALSLTYFSSLFKKPVIYNASVLGDASSEHFGRLQGLVSAIMVLKRSKKESLNIGLLGRLDPTAQIPAFPIVTYTRSIFNNAWRLDVVLPSRLMLQTRLTQNGRLSIGSEFETSNFYIYTGGLVDNANDFEFRQFGVKSGLVYVHLIKDKIVLTGRLGVMNVFQSGMTVKGETFKEDNFVMEFEPKPSGYFSLGISFNPF